jgi:hypothetical protein
MDIGIFGMLLHQVPLVLACSWTFVSSSSPQHTQKELLV